MAYKGTSNSGVYTARSRGGEKPRGASSKLYDRIVKDAKGSGDFTELITFNPDGSADIPTFQFLRIKNNGLQPAEIALKLSIHDEATNKLQTTNVAEAIVFPLMSGEEMTIPHTKMMVWTETDTVNTLADANDSPSNANHFDFTNVATLKPKTGEYTTNTGGGAGDYTADAVKANTQVQIKGTTNSTATSLTLESTADVLNQEPMFKVNDLLWIDDDSTSTEDELIQVTSVNTDDTIDVIRHLNNTNAGGSFADNAKLKWYLGNPSLPKSETAVITDSTGNYYCSSFFGLGRSIAQPNGIVPGSVAIKFVEPGFIPLLIESNCHQSLDSGLTKGTTYEFSCNPNGAGAQDIAFTVSSTNSKLGNASSSDGVIAKIQDALDATFSGQNRVICHLHQGDIRFTSVQKKTSSSIVLAAPADGTSMWGVGIFPAIGNVPTYSSALFANDNNENAILFDDGNGNLSRAFGGVGVINYETGAISISNCPSFSSMQISVAFSTSGAGVAKGDRHNFIRGVWARSLSKYRDASVTAELVTSYADDTTAEYFAGSTNTGLYNNPNPGTGPSGGGGGA